MIYHGDCLEIMPTLPDKSIDMILCDLPYGTTACKWDVVIPFEPLWREYKRLIKDNGAIVLTACQPFTTAIINSGIGLFKYVMYWVKTKPTGFQHAKNRPLNSVEDIVVLSRGSMGHASVLGDKRMKYNPQGLIARNRTIRNAKGKFGGTVGARPSHVDEYVSKHTNYPTNILYFASETKTLHPTQKPVALFEYLIKTYTNEGDTVLDNCAGSGTTGVACINTGRDYILIEKDPAYFEIIKKRLANTQPIFQLQRATA